jgi:hypothetical protein
MAVNGHSTIKVEIPQSGQKILAGSGQVQWQQMAWPKCKKKMCLGARQLLQQLALARKASIKRRRKMSPKINHGAPCRNEMAKENIRPRLLPIKI